MLCGAIARGSCNYERLSLHLLAAKNVAAFATIKRKRATMFKNAKSRKYLTSQVFINGFNIFFKILNIFAVIFIYKKITTSNYHNLIIKILTN